MIRQCKEPAFKLLATAITIFLAINCFSQDKIVRRELIMANVGSRVIKKVDVREINFQPGQKTVYHKHPCPVVGYIVSGTVLFQVEGDSLKTLHAGEAFFEPANTPTVHFDNASNTETLKFIASYLLNEETELIQMLPPKEKE